MGLVDWSSNLIMKLWTEKKTKEIVHQLKEEAGLPVYDWGPYVEQRSIYPQETQVVKEVPNEQHIKMYEQDIAQIEEIRQEALSLIKKELSDYSIMYYFNGTINIPQKEEIRHWRSGGWEADMSSLSTKLYLTSNLSYENGIDVDFALFVQKAYNTFETLLEESKKGVKIAQKGKTGEDYVGSVLRQYQGRFFFLENVVIPAYDEAGKTSETDVYIISSQGIFVCEVKNYGSTGQTILMPEQGDWEIYSGDVYLMSKPSAFVQNERHCNATQSFIKEHLGKNIPIIPVVIIGNNDVEFENYSTGNAVIRATQIYDFIQQFQSVIDYDTQQEIVKAFEENQLDANDFPVKLNAEKAKYLKGVIEEFVPYLKVNGKIAEEGTKLYKQNKLFATMLTLAFSLLCLIPSLGQGIMGIGYVLLVLCAVWGGTGTVATILGLVGLICIMIVFCTGSPMWLAASLAGLVSSVWLSNRNIKEQQQNQ